MIRDRLSWMRLLRFDLGGPTPDENTIRRFRNRLTGTGTLRRVTEAFVCQLQKQGCIPMSGRIGAATPASHTDGRMPPSLATRAWRRRTTPHRRFARTAPAGRGKTRNGWRRGYGSARSIAAAAERPTPQHVARANAGKSAIRSAVESVFADQKNRFGLFIRAIGLARAEAKLTLADLAGNFDRPIFDQRAGAKG